MYLREKFLTSLHYCLLYMVFQSKFNLKFLHKRLGGGGGGGGGDNKKINTFALANWIFFFIISHCQLKVSLIIFDTELPVGYWTNKILKVVCP